MEADSKERLRSISFLSSSPHFEEQPSGPIAANYVLGGMVLGADASVLRLYSRGDVAILGVR